MLHPGSVRRIGRDHPPPHCPGWHPAAAAQVLLLDSHLDPNYYLGPHGLTVSDFVVSDRGGADATLVMTAWYGRVAGRADDPAPHEGSDGAARVRSAGLTMAALVPTDEPGLPLSVAGQVDNYASAALPIAECLLSLRRDVRVTVLVVATSTLATATTAQRDHGRRGAAQH
jgi:hypothetical protein